MVTQSGGHNIFQALWLFVKKLFSWKSAIPITLILILITGFNAIGESWEQKSFKPFAVQVGGKLWNYENSLYLEATKIEQQGGIIVEGEAGEDAWGTLQYIWRFVLASGSLLVNIWWLYFFFLMMYKFTEFLIVMDKSRRTSNLVGAIIFVLIIEIFSGLLLVDEKYSIENLNQDLKIMPFRGIIKTFSILPLLIHPIDITKMEEVVNQTFTT